uniref:Zinc/iron permease n=1 Tax=Megaselia scalaris TaxID=36166 RepID=T1H0I6_MEGSC
MSTSTINKAEMNVNAKVLALSVLGLGSLIFGLLPSCTRIGRYPLVTSVLLCFGAGVLLATSLVHMLPDTTFFL